MTRFAWLQSRGQILVAVALLSVLAVIAAVTGVQLSHLFHRDVAGCTSGCGLAINRFLTHDAFLDHLLDAVARVAPALVGVFWGAPLLAKELETGTFRLAWTQGVTRRRWLVSKLVVGALATLTIAGALTVIVTWWYTSRDHVGGAGPFEVFDRRDLVPVAYALFAFTLGALTGAILRRSLPAMAATLGVFVFIRIAVSVWVRPHLLAARRATLSLADAGPLTPVHLGIGSSNGGPVQLFVSGEGPPRSWTLSSHLLTAAGHRPSDAELAAYVHQHCPDVGPPLLDPGRSLVKAAGSDPGRACLGQVAKTFHVVVSYQPANRYWTFQWLETSLFVALALACALACYWWVTRRAT